MYSLADDKFENLLEAYLASKNRDETWNEEFRAIQRVTHDLVNKNPFMDVGDIMQKLPKVMFEKYGQKLTFKDGSVSKMIGYSNTHRYSEFRNFVRGRIDPTQRK